MAEITVRIGGLSPLIAAIERVKQQIDAATRDATEESADMLQRDARANFLGSHAPGWHHVGAGDRPNEVSGDLQRSIRFLTPTVQVGPATYMNRSGPTMVYSRVIELGARITPKEAKMLSWFDAQMGVQRFESGVTIPPRPYFAPARNSLPPKMYEIFKTKWSGALHG